MSEPGKPVDGTDNAHPTRPLSLGVLLRMAGLVWVVRLGWRRLAREWRLRTAPRVPPATAPAVVRRDVAGERPRFFVGQANRQERAELVARLIPNARERTLVAAEDVLAHRFDVLGSGPTELGAEIDWHADFKTGHRWPLKHHLRLSADGLAAPPADYKVPWDLSRAYHFVTLGKAYAFTGDDRYTREFVAQVTSWLAHNPPGFGINWVGTMEVAIRAVNWVWGYRFFEGTEALTPDFHAAFQQAMDQHGRHILRNLETWWPPTNHLIADLCGSIYLGVMFPELREARRWLRRGMRMLDRALASQVYPDGVVDEGATSYHRLVTELSLSPLLLCHLNDVAVSGATLARLEKMLAVIRAYTRPDGLAPAIGDIDDGRLHVLGSYADKLAQARDHRHLLALGAVFFDQPDMASAAGDQREDALWLFGEKAARMRESASGLPTASAAFLEGGLAFMRHDDHYLSLEAGPHGHGGSGGHAHNDTLSITVSAHGKPFLVDPGAYTYTGDKAERNAFRATAAHNTLQVDGQEINRFDPHDIFFLYDDASQTVHRWESTPARDLLDVWHDGYARLPGRVVHRRQIVFDKEACFWLVRDIVTGSGEHELAWPYHFAPVHVEKGPDRTLVAQESDGSGLLILPLEPGELALSLSEGWISPTYGVKLRAPLAKYTRHAILPATFAVVLYPYRHQPPYDLARAAGERALASLDHETTPV